MILEQIGEVQLPAHDKPGGFDHAAVHSRRQRLYVAHTANDGLDVVDCASNSYIGSIPHLEGVAGALVSEEHDLVFTSNRAENTVGIFSPDREEALIKVKVGQKPNGLAYDPGRRLLLAANVGDPARPGSFSVSLVDASALDAGTQRLFCACDGKVLVVLDARSGAVLAQADLSGVPDVIFFNRERRHLYVAIGEPGLIEVFDTDQMRRVETVRTEDGAHTLGFNLDRQTVYAFLPKTHRALVYADRG